MFSFQHVFHEICNVSVCSRFSAANGFQQIEITLIYLFKILDFDFSTRSSTLFLKLLMNY